MANGWELISVVTSQGQSTVQISPPAPEAGSGQTLASHRLTQ
ncbi:hypothetical protein [Microterricola viridarii]|nr:hypothetical protein [Microterricola viridarii]